MDYWKVPQKCQGKVRESVSFLTVFLRNSLQQYTLHPDGHCRDRLYIRCPHYFIRFCCAFVFAESRVHHCTGSKMMEHAKNEVNVNICEAK